MGVVAVPRSGGIWGRVLRSERSPWRTHASNQTEVLGGLDGLQGELLTREFYPDECQRYAQPERCEELASSS